MVLITDTFLIGTLTAAKALGDWCAIDTFGFSRNWTW